jgi:aspartate kinase
LLQPLQDEKNLSVFELSHKNSSKMQNQEQLSRSEKLYKVGGTSMTNMAAILAAVISLINAYPESSLNYVVSAYGAGNHGKDVSLEKGVTNLLLENKKNESEGGVYKTFVEGGDYKSDLQVVLKELRRINQMYYTFGLDVESADRFIEAEINNAAVYLEGLQPSESRNIMARERLAAIGEIQSAYNLANILKNKNIDVEFVNLSGFEQGANPNLTIDQRIHEVSQRFVPTTRVRIITGYTGGTDGLMKPFGRGYSEVTAAKIAIERKIKALTILKEFALSSADPKIVKNAIQIFKANYRLAAELALVGMEAIHPKIAAWLEKAGIDIQVQNIENLNNPGTLISSQEIDYPGEVQMVTGNDKVIAINLENAAMGVESGYVSRMSEILKNYNILFDSGDTSNKTFVISESEFNQNGLRLELEKEFPEKDGNKLSFEPKSLVVIAGSNLAIPGISARATKALNKSKINIDAMSQSIKQRSLPFIIDRQKYSQATIALHQEFFGIRYKMDQAINKITPTINLLKSLRLSRSGLN